ncbi:MAG: DUF1284 domain-containing protein [Candidatus Pacearchaeota archaeon]|nr:MAG: DUF1284 domain-containing protein [Candidatus Pacearchaeota archaeon]
MSEEIRLKPHHIAIFLKEREDNYKRWENYMKYEFVDGNYLFPDYYKLTKDSLERMVNFFRTLSNSPSTKIEIVNNKDHICGLCDNLVNGKCKYAEGISMERQASLEYDLLDGQIITVKELFEKQSLANLRELIISYSHSL